MRDAILEHPNPEVRALPDVEKVLRIRLVLGAPAQVGPSDPDEVGFVDWQLVIYSCGLSGALEFIHFILSYKVQKRFLRAMPDLAVHVACSGCSPLLPLPAPWQMLEGTAVDMPQPFSALPPKGRRHVLAQLEGPSKEDVTEEGTEEDEAEATYTLTFRGNIYPFKDRFEDYGVPGALAAINEPQQNDYVRYLVLKLDDASKQKVQEVMEDVLMALPLFFINMAGDADPMAAWLLQQPSIMEAEVP